MASALQPLSRVDVQTVSNLAGVQQLFARLGYDASTPIEQTPSALGIAERAAGAIRHIWRVAAVPLAPGLPSGLEVYCLVARTLSADLRKAVVSAFRNKPVQVLFLFTTADFDPLDFVLLERALGPDTTQTADHSGEARAAGFLTQHRVPELYLLDAVDLRARGEDPRTHELDLQLDRIVFRLFELTPEEQRLILSHVGPGRPLPPQRKKRARSAERGPKA